MTLLQGKTIFVVEDDALNLAVISTILRYQGATVYFDRWGVGTIEQMIKLKSIDVILLDLMFPQHVTGYDVFDKIRAMPQLVNIPVVAVTAMDSAAEMNKARAKGFSGYICKPIIRNKFAQYIVTIIGGQQVWAGRS
jgi:CheY-like chemotaxis protein